MEMVFRFAESAHLGGDPQAVGEELHRIRQRGKLTPSVVVDKARAKESVLHRYFDWNDKKAAEKWRIVQARDLISAIVTVKVDDEKTLPVRSFVSVDNSYEPVYHVMSDAEMRQKALEDVQAAIESLQDKIKAFRELADVLKALERVSEVTQKRLVGAVSRRGVRTVRERQGRQARRIAA